MRSMGAVLMAGAAVLLAACDPAAQPDGSTTAATATTATAATPATTGPAATSTTAEQHRVPGLDDPDQFCAAWARYSGTLQAIGVAVAFGDTTSRDVARLEVIAAAALVDAVNGIGSRWPNDLVAERTTVLADVVGPYERRAEKALAAARAAGLDDDQLAQLAVIWLDALRTHDTSTPLIGVPALSAELAGAVDAAAATFDARVTPFADDPTLATAAADTPLTDRYLADHCPDLASSGVGDAV